MGTGSLGAAGSAPHVEAGTEERAGIYHWDRLANGVAVDPVVRRLYRRAYRAAAFGRGEAPPDLSTENGAEALMAWLMETDPARGLPRYVQGLLDVRPDISGAYIDGWRIDGSELVRWVRGRAATETGFDSRLLTRAAEALDQLPFTRPSSVPTPGERPTASRWSPVGRRRRVPDATADDPPRAAGPVVELVGLFDAELGVGEAVRRTAAAFATTTLPHRCVTWSGPSLSRRSASASGRVDAGPADVAIVNVNAELFDRVFDGPQVDLRDRYVIGAWFWELDEFPEEHLGAFDLVDEVWAATRFIADTLTPLTTKPVVHMPLTLAVPPVDPTVTRVDLGLDDRITFLVMFDFFSVIGRKNPEGAIDAYCQAFPVDDGRTRLVIKTINGHECVEDLERLRCAALGRDDIEVRDGYLEGGRVGSLVAQADAIVSLHRSEGLGLVIAEAMALGTPVVATAYSGPQDFMTVTNAWPVSYRLVPVGPGNEPYPASAHWADPDLDVAAAALRAIVDDPDEARRRVALARTDIALFTAEACGARMQRRIEEIRRSRG